MSVAGELAERCVPHLTDRKPAPAIKVVEREVDNLKIAARNQPYATAAVYGGIFLFVGAIAFFSAFPEWVHDRASQHWPAVYGRIVSAEVAVAERKKKPNDTRPTKFYQPLIVYQYQVDDQQLTGSRRYFGVGSEEKENPKPAEKIVSDYPAGKQVRVYYDPQRPAESVLQPGGGAVGNTILCLIGGTLLLIGTPCVAVYTYRTHSSQYHFLTHSEFTYDLAHPTGVMISAAQRFATRNVLGAVFVGLLLIVVLAAVLAGVVMSWK
jgi:hypothetical protein